MEEQLVSSILQTGAVGIVAYLLVQLLREQMKAQRDEYRTLILQLSANHESLRNQLAEIRNTESVQAAAQRLASLEATLRTAPAES